MEDNIIELKKLAPEASEVSEDQEVTDEETEESSIEYFRELAESVPGMDGFEALAAVLAMPDDAFQAMRPLLLEELEKGFNNSNDKYSMAMALNQSGRSVEELKASFDAAIAEVDEKFKDYPEDRRDFVKQILNMSSNCIQEAKAARSRFVRIPIELCHENARLPQYAHDGDAGCDVFALDDYTVGAKQTMLIPLGFKVAIPKGYELQVRPRSGMSLKTKIRISNAPGTIDSTYRGEVGVIIDNIGDYPYYIVKGMKIAQLVLSEVPAAVFTKVEKVDETSRGTGGFGSTGK